MTYEEFKSKVEVLELASEKAGKVLRSFPKGPMGLTPDDIKASPEWKAAKITFNAAFLAMSAFNKIHVKMFTKKTYADTQARREIRIAGRLKL